MLTLLYENTFWKKEKKKTFCKLFLCNIFLIIRHGLSIWIKTIPKNTGTKSSEMMNDQPMQQETLCKSHAKLKHQEKMRTGLDYMEKYGMYIR